MTLTRRVLESSDGCMLSPKEDICNSETRGARVGTVIVLMERIGRFHLCPGDPRSLPPKITTPQDYLFPPSKVNNI